MVWLVIEDLTRWKKKRWTFQSINSFIHMDMCGLAWLKGWVRVRLSQFCVSNVRSMIEVVLVYSQWHTNLTRLGCSLELLSRVSIDTMRSHPYICRAWGGWSGVGENSDKKHDGGGVGVSWKLIKLPWHNMWMTPGWPLSYKDVFQKHNIFFGL